MHCTPIRMEYRMNEVFYQCPSPNQLKWNTSISFLLHLVRFKTLKCFIIWMTWGSQPGKSRQTDQEDTYTIN